MEGVQDITIFLQMFSEDPTAFSPLWSVVQRNISINILQQHVDPSLQNAEQVERSVPTNKILAWAIHHTQTDDRVPHIILASQRGAPE